MRATTLSLLLLTSLASALPAAPWTIDASRAAEGVVVLTSTAGRAEDLKPVALKAYAILAKSDPRIKAAEQAAKVLVSEDTGDKAPTLSAPRLITLVDWKGGRPSGGSIASNATYLVVREINAESDGTGLYQGVDGVALTQITVDEECHFDQESEAPGVDTVTVTLAGPASIQVVDPATSKGTN